MFKLLSGLLGGGKRARENRETAAPPVGSDAGGDLVHQGFELHRADRLAAAAALYRQALAADPESSDALYLLGLITGAEGEHAAAIGLLERAIASDPADPNYHIGLAGELRAVGRIDDALGAFAAAVERKPDEPEWLNDYGNALRLAGRPDAAVARYRQALDLAPEYVDARYNLGGSLLDAGEIDGAAAELERVVAARPDHADAHNNLGLARFHQGRLDAALDRYRRTLELRPDHADAHNNIGLVLQRRNEYDGAIAAYERAAELAPEDGKAAGNLGLALQELGRHREAIAQYTAALGKSDHHGLRIRRATVLPVIAESREAIAAARERLDREVTALLDEPLKISDPVSEVGACNFHLAYHGENDRALQVKTARLHEQACPALGYVAPHCRRPRPRGTKLKVGFVTKFMYEHSIGRTTRGLVAELDRSRFQAIALFAPPFVDDAISRFIRGAADGHLLLSPKLDAARRQIADLELDVLFFQEIGMDPFTYFLAFARLAPVQCVSFGHPDTTGITNMDYFVSTDSFEPEGADAHYSERLVQLENLGTLAYYYRPRLRSAITDRAGFGLASDRTLYLCPQTLFKLHPDFDAILADILRRDPAGEVLLIRGRTPHWARLLEARFERTLPDVRDRITFLPGYGSEDFLKLIDLCDVMLDPIHFNGMNTSLEAFALGVPVITLPKHLQRGRHTYGMYRRMGILDAVAADEREYAELAVRYGTDPGARASLREKILAGNDALFEDPKVVRGFESFFLEACETAAV